MHNDMWMTSCNFSSFSIQFVPCIYNYKISCYLDVVEHATSCEGGLLVANAWLFDMHKISFIECF
jgi:hypothetical protein